MTPFPAVSRAERIALLAGLAILAAAYLKTLGIPSLWLDEAWEANYYAGFTERPWYNRPVLYMLAVRGLVGAFGPHEFVLRLLPCLAGLGAVAATWRLARPETGRVPAAAAAAMLAFAPPFLFAAHQLKHYTLEALFTALLLLSYRRWREERSGARLGVFTGVAAASFAFTFASIFVVAGILAVEVLSRREDRSALLRFLAATGGSLAVFAGLYVAFHRGGAGDPLLTGYFVDDYGPTALTPAWIGWTLRRLAAVVAEQSGAGWRIPALALLGAGALVLVKRGRGGWIAAVAAAAAAANLGASALHLYPFGVTRLSVYLAPLAVVLVAASLVPALAPGRLRLARAAAAAVVAAVVWREAASQARPYATTGWRREHIRPLVETLLRERRPDDAIYVYEDAMPALRFYWSRAGRPWNDAGIVRAARHKIDPTRHAPEIDVLASRHARVWGLFTHLPKSELETVRALLAARFDLRELRVEGDASLGLYGQPVSDRSIPEDAAP